MFVHFANAVAKAVGHPIAFITACFLVITWAILGPVFGFSTTWQLVVNTMTTIVTFLVVFLLQSTQNRDTAEIKAMLKELVEDLPEVDARKARMRAEAEQN